MSTTSSRSGRPAREQVGRRDQDARRAEAALERVSRAECLLQRAAIASALDRRIVAPSACTASVRHERTATPSSRTVQAPQTPCSQPTWVPVSPSSWRRKSDSSSRGSTSARRSTPLTGTSDHSACSSALRTTTRSGVGGRRPTRAGCRAGRRAWRHARPPRSPSRRSPAPVELELEQRGPVDHRADADPRLADHAVLDAERTGGQREREVAVPQRDLLEADRAPAPATRSRRAARPARAAR